MAQMIFSKRGKRTILTSLNPFSKLTALIALSFLLTSGVMEVFAATSIFIIVLMIIVRLPLISYLKKSKALVVLILLIFFTELLVSKSLYSSTYEALKFFFLITLSALLLDSTSPSEIASSLGGVLSHVIGKYAWRFSSFVMLSISFISRIFLISSNMMDARRARLGSFLKHPIKSIGEYVTSLFLSLFEDLREFDLSLRSRLYDENKERIRKEYTAIDYAIIALSLTLSAWINLS